MITLVTFICALFALIIAIMNGVGKAKRPPLWVAVMLLAIAMMLPWIVTRLIF